MRLFLALALPVILTCAIVSQVIGDEEELTLRTFDVGSIVTPEPWRRGPMLGTRLWWMAHDEPPELHVSSFATGDQLADLIREQVDPESWEKETGVLLQFQGTWLVVRHRPEVVRKVDAFLYGLATQAQARALVSVQAVDGEPGAFPDDPSDARARESASLELPMNVQRFLQATNRIRYVTEYEVEIAQASNISNPVVEFPAEGLVADVLVRPMLDGEHLLVEAVVQRGRFRGGRQLALNTDEECFNKPYRSQELKPIGTLDLPVFHHTNVHVTAVTRPGYSVAIPLVQDGRQVTLFVKTQRLGPPAAGPILDLGALTRGPLPMTFSPVRDTEGFGDVMLATAPRRRFTEEQPPPLAYVEDLVEMTRYFVNPGYWGTTGDMYVLSADRVYASADSEMRTRVLDFLVAREKEAVKPVVLDLRVLSVAATGMSESATWQPGAMRTDALPEGARLLQAARLPTLSGRATSLQSGSTANYIADYDPEVAQESRISDPIVGQSFDGVVGRLTPQISMKGGTIAVDLDLTLSRRTIDTEPFMTGARFLGPIDRVQENRFVIETTVRLPSNPAWSYVIDTGPDPDDDTRRRILVLHAERP